MTDGFPQLSQTGAEEKLQEKMKEMKIKELEKRAQISAASSGVPYINLIDFPIAPEALMVIPKDQSESEKVVCFFRGDKDVKVASVDPDKPSIKEIVQKIKEEDCVNVQQYQITENSLQHALKVYKAIPQYKKSIRD